MAKKLSKMTWEELQQEMSIAGSPEKISQLGHEVERLIMPKIDATNRAELTNVELMFRRLIAEIKWLQRRYDSTHR